MKVFASRFLEVMSSEGITKKEDWIWKPANDEIFEIYASGRSTATRESTYAAERDNRADSDRPNEGSLVA